MRQLKLPQTPNLPPPSIANEIQKKIDETAQRQISNEEQVILLQQIRNGDEATIPKLVKGLENHVWRIMMNTCRQQPSDNPEKLFAIAQNALIRLAERELNSTSRERFSDDCTWWIRQSLLQAVPEK